MNLPAGLVFYLDFQYGNNIPLPFQKGQSVYGTLNQTPNSGFGNLASGGLYGQGRFGYSINQFSSSAAIVTVEQATAAQVDFNISYLPSTGSTTSNLVALTFTTASISSVMDTNGVRAFELSGSGTLAVVSPANVINDFTVISGGNITFFVTSSAVATINAATGSNPNVAVFYNKSTNFQTRGDFEDAPQDTPVPFSNPNAASSASIVIPEINVQMKSETISAKTRKLKAQWTPEFAQDLNAYHSLDAEAELTGMLSEYISLEIDLEILDMLIENAQTVAN